MVAQKVFQVIFVVLNCLFLLGGILLIAAGGSALSGVLDSIVAVSSFRAVSGIMIAIGIFLLAIALFGLIGGVRKNRVLLRIVCCVCVVGDSLWSSTLLLSYLLSSSSSLLRLPHWPFARS